MPWSAPAKCRTPLCRNLTRDGHCPACRSSREKTRGTAASRGLGARHRKMRERVLREEPLCRRCRREASDTADHKVAVKTARALGWTEAQVFARSNYQGLCGTCNTRKAIEEEGGLGRRPVRARVAS